MLLFVSYVLFLTIVLLIRFIFKRKINLWLPSYTKGRCYKKDYISRKHIIFCFVDHFEPKHGNVSSAISEKRMQVWTEQYPLFANRYLDSYGNRLQHTWFYPYDELKEDELNKLNSLCQLGYGEVEFHLHHKNDNEQSLKNKIREGQACFNKHGIGITISGQKAYGFIHGDWALNNSVQKGSENFCGVNNELSVLKQSGCYADFTFPAYMSDSQPALVNTIYYAKSTQDKPKGHNKGKPVIVGQAPTFAENELMIIPGPLGFNWHRRKWNIFPTVEDGNIHQGNLFHPTKVDLWERMHIHVKGKPEWLFIKIFTHGAPERNHDAVFGNEAVKLFNYIDSKFKENNKKLHYVTAREMFNIIKAAESGETGDPESYRDYEIKPYKNLI